MDLDFVDGSYLVSTSLKNETRSHEDSSFTVSTSLKNETIPFPNLKGKPSFQPPS